MAIIEVQRFVEFPTGWWDAKEENRTKDLLSFEPMTINTLYVAWVRRWSGPFNLCEAHMADRGGEFVFDMSYETMRSLIREARSE